MPVAIERHADPDEIYGSDVVGTVSLPSFQRAALAVAIRESRPRHASSSGPPLRATRPTETLDLFDTFRFRFVTPKAAKSEWQFFRYAARFDELDDLTAAYVENVVRPIERGKRHSLWHGRFAPGGTWAIEPLAPKAKRHVRAYARFLRANDMDHEVRHRRVINEIVEAHGWCPETCELAAVRKCTAFGQSGDLQMGDFRAAKLPAYLTNERNAKHFVDACFADVRSGPAKLGPDAMLERFEWRLDSLIIERSRRARLILRARITAGIGRIAARDARPYGSGRYGCTSSRRSSGSSTGWASATT